MVERLAESEGMARASQIATEATKLGALGVANGGDVSCTIFIFCLFVAQAVSLGVKQSADIREL